MGPPASAGGPFSAPKNAGLAPRAISFPSCGKRYGRKGRRGRGIALTRLKSLSFRFACYRYTVRSPNALRAGDRISAFVNCGAVNICASKWKAHPARPAKAPAYGRNHTKEPFIGVFTCTALYLTPVEPKPPRSTSESASHSSNSTAGCTSKMRNWQMRSPFSITVSRVA